MRLKPTSLKMPWCCLQILMMMSRQHSLCDRRWASTLPKMPLDLVAKLLRIEELVVHQRRQNTLNSSNKVRTTSARSAASPWRISRNKSRMAIEYRWCLVLLKDHLGKSSKFLSWPTYSWSDFQMPWSNLWEACRGFPAKNTDKWDLTLLHLKPLATLSMVIILSSS